MDQLWHQISFLSLVLSAFLVPVDPQELQLTMASDGLERAVSPFGREHAPLLQDLVFL